MTKKANATAKPRFFNGPQQTGPLGFTLLYHVDSIKLSDCSKITAEDARTIAPSENILPNPMYSSTKK